MTARSLATATSLRAEHRQAVARALGLGALLFPVFYLLDAFAALTLYPKASLVALAVTRAVTTALLFGAYFVIKSERVSDRVADSAHVLGLAIAGVAIALQARELGGPRSPYMHGITIVIMVRSAIVPAPVRESLLHGLSVVAAYPLVFAILAALDPGRRSEWLAPGEPAFLAVNFLLVSASVACGCIASATSWAARRQLYQARRLGRYRLEARLGGGGQGEVWLARDASLQRDVALKILHASSATPTAIEAFEREARLASQLRSPHTVRVHDFGASDDGIHFIAMEHLSGYDLSEMVKLFGPVPPARAAHLVIQACRSLEEAHAAGLVHRDVKPSNLFAAQVGDQRDLLKVLDFGVARSVAEDGERTRAGVVRGTPTYLAPECCKGEPATPASDLYALGATLYFLVTATPPFVGDDLHVVAQHREDAPERPSARLGAELPPAFEAIVLRCLAKAPADRFESVRALREALEACEGIGAWDAADARRFWDEERKDRIRRWSDDTHV